MNFVNAIASSPIVSAVAGVIVAATAHIIVQFYRRRQQKQDDVKQWYQDSLGLVSRVQRLGYRTTEYQTANYDTLHDKLDPLADELQEHAGSAPDGVSDESRKELHFLAAFCTGIITLSEQSENLDAVEFLELVQENARKSYDGDYDIELINELIEPIDIDEIVGGLPAEDVESDEKAIDEFLSHFAEQSIEDKEVQSIEEALGMPLGQLEEMVDDGSIWDEMMEETMREYTRLFLIDVAEDLFNTMEQRKQQL